MKLQPKVISSLEPKVITALYSYVKENDETVVKINEAKKNEMVEKFPLLLKNNPAFKKLVDILQENRKRVLITDVKGQGKSLKTLLYLLKMYDIKKV